MATYTSFMVLPVGNPTNITGLAATTASAEQASAAQQIILVVASGDCNIVVGQTGMTAPTASSLRIPANTLFYFDMGRNTALRFYNPGGSAINIQWTPVYRQ